MTADFKALDISYEVQRSFANKFFSNKNVAKGLIDATSAALLDELYKLIKIYVRNAGSLCTCIIATCRYSCMRRMHQNWCHLCQK